MAQAEANNALLSRVTVAKEDEGEEGEDAAICGATEGGTGMANTEGGGEEGEDATIRGAAQGGTGQAAGSDDDIDRRGREPWTGEGAGTGGGSWSFGRGSNGPLAYFDSI